MVPDGFHWTVVAHELGHTFGLEHDFRDNAYIMSYGLSGGSQRSSLSACSAEFLAVDPYFNPDTPTEEEQPPSIELISPTGYTPKLNEGLCPIENQRFKWASSGDPIG